ncbi:MAG: calcium/sodium antiporter [Hyphomicrobiales bacterium]|nr:calcium/sodium antiporter [Hyphomicrobiales bacterium]
MDLGAISWQLPAGIIMLTIGGDLLVRGAVRVATALNVSRLLIGITLVGFGTSLPEMVTSIRAALVGSPGIAVGNIVGSNIANLLLVIGAAAIIYPLATPRDSVMRNGGMVAFATLLLVGIVHYGVIDRAIGGLLIGLLILYFVYCYVHDRRMTAANGGKPHGDEDIPESNIHVVLALLMAIGGVSLIIFGARWLVDSSIELARFYNISETFIGLTVVAIGTSLPELVTTIIAALRKQTAIGVGNILGSNIQNIFGILGVTAIIQPIEIPEQIMRLDIWIMTAATAIFLIFAYTNARLSRFEGLLLISAYAGYIALLTYLDVLPVLTREL